MRARHGVFLAGVMWATLAVAYPIPPQTIWQLSAHSERIVYAEVVRHVEDGVVELRVLETWKGTRALEFKVHYEPNWTCPAPPVFVDGKRVIAFLARGDRGRWEVVGLSYGTRYPADAGEVDDAREVIRDAVKRAPSYRRVKSYEDWLDVPPAPTDWAVLAATKPATRWDGLYLLAQEGDAPHARYDAQRPTRKLDSAQRQQLVDAFVDRPTRDHTVPMLLQLLRGQPDAELDATIASVLDAEIRDEPPYWADAALRLFRERLGAGKKQERPEPDAIQRTFADAMGDYTMEDRAAYAERLSREWAELKQQFRLEPAVLPEKVEPPVRGVGGETPL